MLLRMVVLLSLFGSEERTINLSNHRHKSMCKEQGGLLACNCNSLLTSDKKDSRSHSLLFTVLPSCKTADDNRVTRYPQIRPDATLSSVLCERSD